ncbi:MULTISPECIES: sugar ABC transporter substrate-binding protein [unclassified Lysobacter]|uniref:sugar ABC transporter substrate-binding protein n=1 Tax=unclassified Lysobacter TaxID=2635362 RepID=UPI001BE7323B|nr:MULTISPECIES: sugar ABC transporter substrate-binding protein [unclassified Lysobacter]MBT2747980.1 sugar ABC transporter substrate-binding protein [Lysobacter sp. ISL-42]MBT2752808.1 sugar ABC transporter substrate-binding protein [Lysobacter sp. ISL-50]MBT2779396.1 sugar ABC transporter substrate-binding protein [Lysobacter sp. ISL-54]MBT2781841.1 sugar ABC transporter substrate-binding protein [Lysobacter sp. ISL-52]
MRRAGSHARRGGEGIEPGPRARALAAIALGAALLLGACSQRDDGRERVRFWAMGYEGEQVLKLIPEFERRNPGIRVEVQQLPISAAHEKLLTAFAGDALPDVGAIGNTWISEFALLDALTPLDARLTDPAAPQRQDYFFGAWDTGVIGGTTFAVPWYVETRLPYYRRDLLEQAGIQRPPTTWDEWKVAMAAIKREVGPKRYATLFPLNEAEPLLNLGIQAPEPLLREDGRYGNFRSPGFKRALSFYREVFDKQWAPLASNTQIANVWNEFGRGYFSFYVNGPWNIAEFRNRLPADLQSSWMTMPLPGEHGPGASVAGGASFVLFRGAKREDAAWKLIAYLSEPDVQAKFHEITGDLPPRRSAWNAPKLAGDVYARAFRDQLERARPAPKVPEWERIATEVKLVGEQLANGRVSVDEAAAELDRRADRILEKRRWMLDHQTLKPAAGAAKQAAGAERSLRASDEAVGTSSASVGERG